MRVGITGAKGQLGQELSAFLASQGYTIFPFSRQNLDITDPRTFEKTLSHLKLDFLINAAAFTDVDLAEARIELAFKINAEGPANLANFCKSNEIKLIHISTDAVFSSEYPILFETTSNTNPINSYGRSKAAGEISVSAVYPEGSWIIRTAWIYGKFGGRFVHAIMNKAFDASTISVIGDQFGQPISTLALSRFIDALIKQNSSPGIYHCASRDYVSRSDFAQAILKKIDMSTSKIQETKTRIEIDKALRPKYSLLNVDVSNDTLDVDIESWEFYLTDFLQDLRGKR